MNAMEDVYEMAGAYERTQDLPERSVQDFLLALEDAGVKFDFTAVSGF